MMETANYIFGRLRATDNAVGNIRKILKKQARSNGLTVALVCFTAAYTYDMWRKYYEQSKQIEKLNDKIEKLERGKGK